MDSATSQTTENSQPQENHIFSFKLQRSTNKRSSTKPLSTQLQQNNFSKTKKNSHFRACPLQLEKIALIDRFPRRELLDHPAGEAAGLNGGGVQAVPLEERDPLLEVLDAQLVHVEVVPRAVDDVVVVAELVDEQAVEVAVAPASPLPPARGDRPRFDVLLESCGEARAEVFRAFFIAIFTSA